MGAAARAEAATVRCGVGRRLGVGADKPDASVRGGVDVVAWDVVVVMAGGGEREAGGRDHASESDAFESQAPGHGVVRTMSCGHKYRGNGSYFLGDGSKGIKI